MKLKGRVAFRDIETGIWILEAEDGRIFQLSGGDRGLKKEGLQVEIEGEVRKEAMTLGMVGPLLEVRSYRTG